MKIALGLMTEDDAKKLAPKKAVKRAAKKVGKIPNAKKSTGKSRRRKV